ncbi:hypothetical protein I7I48_02017 [Histoplasma ohiense]|nr:hypothetical protein I7I48_02017 [Histoplasma ohiense (nom. inval.)]
MARDLRISPQLRHFERRAAPSSYYVSLNRPLTKIHGVLWDAYEPFYHLVTLDDWAKWREIAANLPSGASMQTPKTISRIGVDIANTLRFIDRLARTPTRRRTPGFFYLHDWQNYGIKIHQCINLHIGSLDTDVLPHDIEEATLEATLEATMKQSMDKISWID